MRQELHDSSDRMKDLISLNIATDEILRGHCQHFGIRCNYKMLEVVLEFAKQREVFPLPKPRIVHDF